MSWALALLSCVAGTPEPISEGGHGPPPADAEQAWTNRLATERSPYLLLHAHNPVDWYPWGEEAFAEAARRDVPVFLSIGYTSCHWCHVMEEESFSDPKLAAILNAGFISVKVDREERPDIDAIYLEALQGIAGRGGWPANLFLTPDRLPFDGGTYFPPTPSRGRPSLRQKLESVERAWAGDRGDLLARARKIRTSLEDQAARARGDSLAPIGALDTAVAQLLQSEDREYGGWGSKKFPRPPILELLLDRAALGDEDAGALLDRTLEAMARGGIQDQVGGGFHRYTLDRAWRTPHFEKMLYDNAQLAAVYADAYRVLGDPRWAQVAQDTLDYMIRELWSEDGGFYASQGADSPGGEGAFYVWTPSEVRQALPKALAPTALRVFGVTAKGNFAGGTTVLHQVGEAPPELREIRDGLYADRLLRAPPETDTKRIVSWNGLALTALARGAMVLDDGGDLLLARRLGAALLSAQRPDGGMPRTLPDGPEGVLDDYAFAAEGLLDLYEVDPDPRWLHGASSLARALLDRFALKGGGFAYTTPSADRIARQVVWRDGVEPSGMGRSCQVLLRLSDYGEPGISDAPVVATLERAHDYLEGASAGYQLSSLLVALQDHLRGPREVVITGAPEHPDAAAMIAIYTGERRPGTVFARAATPSDDIALLRDKPPAGERPVAYVCRAGACALPTSDPEAFRAQLAALR